MAKKQQQQQTSDEVGDSIQIPSMPNVRGGMMQTVEDSDLATMQESLFGKKDKKDDPESSKGKPANTNGTPVDRSTKGKKTADEIFQKTQQTNKEIKNQKQEPEITDDNNEFTGSFPEFDSSQFLPGESESEASEDEDSEGDVEEPSEDEVEDAADKSDDKDVDFSKEENLKNLRKVAGNFKKERDEARKELEALQKRPDTKALQDQITQLKTRNEELEKYELVFGLQNNPAFKKKFIDPSNQIIQEMKQIVTDYGLDGEIVDDLLLINNRRDLDETLEETFSSSSARNDIKTLKQRFDGLQQERAEAEKKPREVLDQFQSSQAQTDAETNQRRETYLKEAMSDAWAAALGTVAQAEGHDRILELVQQPGKKDHNEKVVAPTLGTAQNLFQDGLVYLEKVARNKSVVDRKFVQWFAQLCQQAAATRMVNHVRWGIYEQYNKLLDQQKKQGQFDRPGIASKGKPSAPSAKRKKGTGGGRDIAATIFQEVVTEK